MSLDPAGYKLLNRFQQLFEVAEYRHRVSNNGDLVASFLIDDVLALGQSSKLADAASSGSSVLNSANRTTGKTHRRGDGTFGRVVPGAKLRTVPGYAVSFGQVANIEIGAETKILAKAMIKQIDRVCTDMVNQAAEFRKHGNNPICVGIVGINHASMYRSLEKDREWITDGSSSYRHPIQEAEEAEKILRGRVVPQFDEVVFLRFKATNMHPLQFAWLNSEKTFHEYGAALVRLAAQYQKRF